MQRSPAVCEMHIAISFSPLCKYCRKLCYNKSFSLYCHLAICWGNVLGFEVVLFFICYGVWSAVRVRWSSFFFFSVMPNACWQSRVVAQN